MHKTLTVIAGLALALSLVGSANADERHDAHPAPHRQAPRQHCVVQHHHRVCHMR